MIMNKETKKFILENIEADILQLALQAARFPLVDMPLAIRQINGKQKIKSKVPSFYQNDAILYPVQLSLEQSSSEATAKYKANLCEGHTLVDLTGGFGIDTFIFANRFKQVTYVERQPELCRLATHNFNIMGQSNIKVVEAQAEEFLTTLSKVDWIYVDPARRNSQGKKVIFLSDCEPNISDLWSLLREKAWHVMIKLSPMIDISAVIGELPGNYDIHIISVDNECKEVLLIFDEITGKKRKIKTVNILKNKNNQFFEFSFEEENAAENSYSTQLKKYLYEPNASVLKSGAFKSIGTAFGLNKLHINTHLYTSSKLSLQFPGRIFEVQKCWGNSKKEQKDLVSTITNANISVRNYPSSVEELRRKLKIKEGGEIYLFACTLASNQKVIVECKKIMPDAD